MSRWLALRKLGDSTGQRPSLSFNAKKMFWLDLNGSVNFGGPGNLNETCYTLQRLLKVNLGFLLYHECSLSFFNQLEILGIQIRTHFLIIK